MSEYCPRCDGKKPHSHIKDDILECDVCELKSSSKLPDEEWINVYTPALSSKEVERVYWEAK